jgi:hypothetical protein
MKKKPEEKFRNNVSLNKKGSALTATLLVHNPGLTLGSKRRSFATFKFLNGLCRRLSVISTNYRKTPYKLGNGP